MELICACADENLKKKLVPKIKRYREIDNLSHALNEKLLDEMSFDEISDQLGDLPDKDEYNKLDNEQSDLDYKIVGILQKEAPHKCEFSDLSSDYSSENPALEVEIWLEIDQAIRDLLESNKTEEEIEKDFKSFPGDFTDKNELPELYNNYLNTIKKIGIPNIIKRVLVSREDFEEDIVKKVLEKELDIIKKAVDGKYHYVTKLYGDAI